MFVFLAQILVLIVIVIVALALRQRKKSTDSNDLTGSTYPQLKTSTRCHVCGFENPSQARFCGNCGAALVINTENKQ